MGGEGNLKTIMIDKDLFNNCASNYNKIILMFMYFSNYIFLILIYFIMKRFVLLIQI